MAIAKKGSRRIVVDSMPYRWTVRPRPAYTQALAQVNLSFAAELETDGRCILVVTVDAARPDNWLGIASGVVTPVVVERAIRLALQQGWTPGQCGSAFELTMLLSSAQPGSPLDGLYAARSGRQ
jgi:hypothetical protein